MVLKEDHKNDQTVVKEDPKKDQMVVKEDDHPQALEMVVVHHLKLKQKLAKDLLQIRHQL